MTVEAHKETLGFQTEVQQLLRLVAHSLYSHKEVFLRELISNASDACDKLRFEALTDGALYENDPELKIRVSFDKDARTITVADNGIGMDRQEVIDNIGTIARSGTRQFMQKLTGDQAKDANLIGQFGVGFYSSFVVADRVTLRTRRAGMGAEHGVYWESIGEGEYTLETIEKPDRGTEVVLHLREEDSDLLNEWQLRSIITKYSDHITLPVMMPVEKPAEDKDAPPVVVEERINQAAALWARSKNDIKEEEYKEFYKHVGHDFEDPLAWTHHRVEGKLEYTSLLFIPTRAPFDLWDREQRHGVKLYVQRVFIMDDADHLMPRYLRFVRGVIDSNDLPLNISRELLQGSKVVDSIRAGSVKKVLGLLEDMANNDAEKYSKFWKEFGRVLKEGPAEDYSNREQIAKLLRYASTHNDTPDQTVSLTDYLGRMNDGQDKIYYISADSFAAAKNSPHLEIFRKKGLEVLLLTDRVDEWLMSHLTEFEGKHFQSVAKGALDLDKIASEEEKQEQKQAEDQYQGLLTRVKDVLGDKVKEVRISSRLTDSPACLVVDEYALSAHLERLLRDAGQSVPMSKPYLELNPAHSLIARLKDEADVTRFGDWTNLLFEQAVLAEGGQLEDPASFVKRLNGLLLAMG
ncbi:MAG TPA: molecular chaperone HtpG [Candidatus Competibacteraceae bacterium]|nr:molecular chaperone HtpG [Candidatus Competibacteraceae bacterium]HSA45592.1 molecular chaperone HtpG [Candidatus Competibacteraceae bacterium]